MDAEAKLKALPELMGQNWLVFRKHHPVGAYLPVGQLDGDCRGCGAEWPCPTVRDVMSL